MRVVSLAQALEAAPAILAFFTHPDFPHAPLPDLFDTTVVAVEGDELGVMYVTKFECRTDVADGSWFDLLGAIGGVLARNPHNTVDLVIKHTSALEQASGLVVFENGQVVAQKPKEVGPPYYSIGLAVNCYVAKEEEVVVAKD